ncbi:hypothetical protein CFC21_043808 [Triticum aestivum]|uniref:Rapid alkalinization factor 1 n=3 Tax=Triticum TaxID=4564 RepID=A0A3B6FZ84_WHEAT|nr:rapid alkalinization factor-like [Triticum dicoccoides]XP_044345372.1 rapid alkalinization factor-like [Triticum aestivum]VAH84239.1 unnamed protein product [Triticum turgidum subsp. durum]KAF7032649.1 hypothetical protein CFC21_043802 [Triticum aestivum]KAF7032656.1 hypothetical protein CFC21_043808 [Triticum aestivum]CDM86027.1 unnamed protein product [Triticum aestivum]
MAPPLPSRALIVAITALLVLVVAAELDAGSSGWAGEDYGGGAATQTACRVEDEEGCGREATPRRHLGGGGYIGYDALRRNAVPCSVRGASYYNCRPGGQANPYSRGCSSITRCRG